MIARLFRLLLGRSDDVAERQTAAGRRLLRNLAVWRRALPGDDPVLARHYREVEKIVTASAKR